MTGQAAAGGRARVLDIATMSATSGEVRATWPVLGADYATVYGDLGLSAEEQRRQRDAGIL